MFLELLPSLETREFIKSFTETPNNEEGETVKGLFRQRVDLYSSSQVVEEDAQGRETVLVSLQPVHHLAV